MERIIKFKAKRLDNGEWVEGDLYHNVRGFECCIGQQEKDDVYIYQVDLCTVCQFTGLTDMKGREIWEHDNITDFPHCGEVIFVDGEFAMHSDVGNLPLETFIDRVKDGALGTYGKCLVTNQGSKFDKKGGEHEEVS